MVTDAGSRPYRARTVGWITLAFGALEILFVSEDFLRYGGRFQWGWRLLVQDLAFGLLPVVAGAAVLVEVRWAQASAAAVWGALIPDAGVGLYRFGRYNLLHWRGTVVIPDEARRSALALAILVVGPWIVRELCSRPSPPGMARRIVVICFLGGILVSSAGLALFLGVLKQLGQLE